MAENEKKVPETAEVSEKETKAVKKEAKSKKDKKPSRVIAWFRTTKAELKKISWTPKKTLVKNTIIALGGMAALGVVIALLDFVFNRAIAALSIIF
ncbi:MAG: preprotein translocase subunit SecE [Clostridia bacterium]|jgi:preprotein translocase SecE subunit|nr:preprotein translocase subunit SecE [Clostridia bacterium]